MKGAVVSNDSGTVPGAFIRERRGEPAMAVQPAHDADSGPQKEPGRLDQGGGKPLHLVCELVCLQVVSPGVNFPAYVCNGVGGLKSNREFHAGGIGIAGSSCGEDNVNVVSGVDEPAGYKAVHSRAQSQHADVSGNNQMQQIDAVIACPAPVSQPGLHGSRRDAV